MHHATWLHNPCRLGDPHRLRAGGRIRKRPTSGQDGYITPLGAFGARWLLGLIPLTTNCRPEAPRGGGGGGSWRPRTRGVAPPGPQMDRAACAANPEADGASSVQGEIPSLLAP